MHVGRIRIIAPALLLLLSSPSMARAQASAPDSTSAQTAARSMGAEGLKLYNEQRWGEAYERFREADDLYHAPTLVLFMARCLQAQGKLVEAAATYEKVLAEPLPDGASKAFVDAHDSASIELASVRKRTPKVILELVDVSSGSAPAASSVHVTLDGASVSVGELAVNPGSHAIRATAENAEPIERLFTIDETSTQRIRLAFKARPPTSLPATAPRKNLDDEPSKGSLVPAMTAFGVGAVSLSVGAITGALSMSKVSALKSKCAGSLCPIETQDEANAAGTLGTVSTAGFIVGGLGVATGVVLLFVRPGGGPALTTTAGAAKPVSGVAWSASLGIGRFDLQGSF
ncbi:MAG TPA: hypothetical protein VEX38_01000 [Fimbriimonadaceae bacterium]|nr:hypothetical protein [Fimbriimonadaceae bacterium]